MQTRENWNILLQNVAITASLRISVFMIEVLAQRLLFQKTKTKIFANFLMPCLSRKPRAHNRT